MQTVIRERRPITPLQRAADQVRIDNAPGAVRKHPKTKAPLPPPEFGPPVELDHLTEGLVFRREQALVTCLSLRVRRWLLERFDPVSMWYVRWQQRIHTLEQPDLPLPFALLPIYVEAVLKARVLFPDDCSRVELEADEDEADVLQWDEATATDQRLTIHARPKKARKPKPNLPGCQGFLGAECANLRRFGEKYCPACARKELERIRAGG
jgi:hypothetical protein